MRIGIVVNEFFREDLGGFGGYGSLARYLAMKYNKQKYPFEFLVFLIHEHPSPEVLEENTVIYPLKKSVPPIKFLEYKKRLNKTSVDLLLSIELSPGYLYALLQKSNTPLIIWLQDPRSWDEWRFISTSRFIYHKEAHGMEIEKILANYKRTYAIVKKFYDKKITFATQARFLRIRGLKKYQTEDVLKAPFLPNPIPIPSKVKFSEKADTPTILFLGRLDPIKRPWIFFEIAKELPEYNFIVAGTPHDPEYMKHKIEPYIKLKNLKFLGLITGEKKDRVLRKSWILVNTSIHEALPVSFLEAFAYKIPIVSCQNPDGLVSDFGKYIGRVPGDGYESVRKFAYTLKELLNNEKEIKQKGQKARKYVKKYHTFQVFEKTIFNIYKRLE